LLENKSLGRKSNPRRLGVRQSSNLFEGFANEGSATAEGGQTALASASAANFAETIETIVQRWLGHARIETTAICASAIGDEERNLARRAWSSLELAIPQ